MQHQPLINRDHWCCDLLVWITWHQKSSVSYLDIAINGGHSQTIVKAGWTAGSTVWNAQNEPLTIQRTVKPGQWCLMFVELSLEREGLRKEMMTCSLRSLKIMSTNTKPWRTQRSFHARPFRNTRGVGLCSHILRMCLYIVPWFTAYINRS